MASGSSDVAVRPRPSRATHSARTRYAAPSDAREISIEAVRHVPRSAPARLVASTLFIAGDLGLLDCILVAVVGARAASEGGRRRAKRVARELVERGVVVVSGLAAGIDTVAHAEAIANGGRTIGVIGTPLDRAYPAENAALQERIWRDHLLISQFAVGARTHPGSFPERNKLMAAISRATVIIEASDTSGTLHQAAECVRLGQHLFLPRSLVDDQSVRWPSRFVGTAPCVHVLDNVDQILTAIVG